MTGSKKDANHNKIKKAAQAMGAFVLDTHTLKNAFDMLIYYRGQTLTIEVKDGTKPPSQRKLTPGEIQCKQRIEGTNNHYHIIKSVDELIELLNSPKV